jgi:hypothetical protein
MLKSAASDVWKNSMYDVLLRQFRISTRELGKFFGHLQNFPVVMIHKFKAQFDAKSVVEMTLAKAQHKIGCI